MARMMPPYCPTSAPPGERALFDALASSPGCRDWIVMHSLCIATHVRQVQGEADFVVIVPGHGIAVIEVKSHLSIDRLADGRWKLGNQAPSSRSPFQQASDCMHSIRDYLTKAQIDLRSIPLVSAVWFTHVRARATIPTTPEWHHWQVLDQEDLRADPGSAVLRVLSAGRAHLSAHIRSFDLGAVGPDPKRAPSIASVLRPRFEVATVPADMRRDRESQLDSFIDEQYDALDAMAENHAVLFVGPAGSGKTLLAIEAARREVAAGGTGRMLCFNRFLGRSLKEQTAEMAGLKLSSFHQALLEITGIVTPDKPTPTFWEHDLVERALEKLLEQDQTKDFLIVDELQDLARDEYLDIFELMVKGGLSSGRVLFFGDFERQAIFDTSDGRDVLRSRVPNLSTNSLRVNCRNRPRIGTVVNTLSKIKPGYRRFRRQDDGIDPTFVTYRDSGEQSPLLAQAVRDLRDEGYQLEEIVVLSPRQSGSVVHLTNDTKLRQILIAEDGRAPRRGRLRFSTIHAFKGLESPAVILTDLDSQWAPTFNSLLYVGMTRATDRLIAIVEGKTLRSTLGGQHDRS
jgi:RecA/RadA recombinase